MGARGPKAKPTNLRMLEGNPGRATMNRNEPQPEGGAVCPGWLSAEAKRHWAHLAPMLESCGLLTAADADTLAAYCEAWAGYKKASKKVQRAMFIKGRANPAIAVQAKFLTQVMRFGTRLGLSPADRTGIKVSPTTKGGKWAGLIK